MIYSCVRAGGRSTTGGQLLNLGLNRYDDTGV